MAGDPNSVTVSGHQEGATFACSLQIILSDTIKGAGCIKGAAFAFDPDNLADGETADDIADEALDLIDTIEASCYLQIGMLNSAPTWLDIIGIDKLMN